MLPVLARMPDAGRDGGARPDMLTTPSTPCTPRLMGGVGLGVLLRMLLPGSI